MPLSAAIGSMILRLLSDGPAAWLPARPDAYVVLVILSLPVVSGFAMELILSKPPRRPRARHWFRSRFRHQSCNG